MSARVPTRTFTLPTSPTLTASPQTIAVRTWVAHLVRHPLGTYSTARNRPWNAEGFDALSPPVVTEDTRAAFVNFVRDEPVRGGRCEVHAFSTKAATAKKRGLDDSLPCYGPCSDALVFGCRSELRSISDGYQSLVDALLDSLSDGVSVDRATFTNMVLSTLQRPQDHQSAVVLSSGALPDSSYRDRVVRIHRGDGVRTEFYARGRELTWRTTYRIRPTSPVVAVRELLDLPVADSASAAVLVSRPWWQQQQDSHR
jgi:hypothetical protein